MKEFKAGKYIQQDFYKSFQPNLINRQWVIDDMELISLLGNADREIGRLDMYSEYIPNINLFIHMHVMKEATQSSKIEGTQTNIEEALLEKNDIPLDKRNDWEEIQNYVEAMNYAIDKLSALPFSSRLIKDTHQILLQGVRGDKKTPGEFRTSQNWIGGASISDAAFIPPHQATVIELMSDLEKFAHNEEIYFPQLLKIALIHYQFETIHPFLDGNGRIGRLMITLYLVNTGILKKPILYLSDFFERHRLNYYDKLTLVRQKDDILGWFKFFLVGVIETCKKSVATFDNILKLQQKIDRQFEGFGPRTTNALKLINSLYQNPITDANKVTKLINITNVSAYKLITSLEQMGILKETTGLKRGKIYIFEDYLKLFQ